MPTPPFANDDYTLPITAGSYVNDIESNFALTRSEMLSLYSQIQSGAVDSSFFDAGILEVNGHFQLTRLLNKRVSYESIGATDRVWTSNFFNLLDGAGMGYAGTAYTYHPTQAVGWYIAKEMMLAGNDFGQFTGADQDIFQLFLKGDPRADNPAAEDKPTFYQPVSVHLPRHRWAGKDLTIRLKYKCNISQAASLYGQWSGGAGGLVRMPSSPTEYLENTGGDFRTLVLAIRPDDDATNFEFGLLVNSTNAMTLEFEYFILTDSANRYTSGEKSAAMLALQTALGQRYYCQYSGVRTQGSFLLNPSVIVDTAAQIQDIIPFTHNQQMVAPGEKGLAGIPYFDNPDLWPLASTYSKEAILAPAYISPLPFISAIHDLWHRTNHTVAVSVRPRFVSASDPGAFNPTLAEDMRQHYAAVTWDVYLHYTTIADDLRKLLPCCPSVGYAEAVNNFPPLFT